jgi:hypothetical protein
MSACSLAINPHLHSRQTPNAAPKVIRAPGAKATQRRPDPLPITLGLGLQATRPNHHTDRPAASTTSKAPTPANSALISVSFFSTTNLVLRLW